MDISYIGYLLSRGKHIKWISATEDIYYLGVNIYVLDISYRGYLLSRGKHICIGYQLKTR